MNTQQLLLRVMLWSLAIAAGLGIVAVAFVQSDWTWQVVGTGIATAIACAVLIPASALSERPQFQIAGIIAMILVLLEYLGSILLIWEIDRAIGSYRTDEQIGLTMFFMALAALMAVGLMWAKDTRFGRSAAWIGIGIVVTTFIWYEIAIWLGRRSKWDDECWAFGSALFCLLGLAVLCHAGTEELPPRRWRYLGIITAVVAFILAAVEIWLNSNRKWTGAVFVNLTAFSVVIAHANLITFCRLKPDQRWVRNISVGATSLTAIFVALLITDEIMRWHAIDNDAFGRLAAATGIAASFATIALCVLWRMNAKSDALAAAPIETIDHLGQVDITCPRCKIQQSLDPGKNQCAHCELKIEINFEEPRCTNCEYLLVGLTGQTCPECGKPIVIMTP